LSGGRPFGQRNREIAPSLVERSRRTAFEKMGYSLQRSLVRDPVTHMGRTATPRDGWRRGAASTPV